MFVALDVAFCINAAIVVVAAITMVLVVADIALLASGTLAPLRIEDRASP